MPLWEDSFEILFTHISDANYIFLFDLRVCVCMSDWFVLDSVCSWFVFNQVFAFPSFALLCLQVPEFSTVRA